MAGAGTLGIHLRWLPRARIEIPFRDCRRGTASRSANPATINVPSRLETKLTTASCGTNAAALGSSPIRVSPYRVANHPPRHSGRESGVPGASEPGSRRQSITPPPQSRGGSNETSRCHHGPRALPLRAAMRPDPLPSVANHKTPPQARGGSNGTSRCRHSQRAPLSAPNRDLTPDGPSRQSHKTPSRGRGVGVGVGVGEHPIVVRCRARGTIPASHPAKPRPDP